MDTIVVDIDNVISETDAKIRNIIKRNYGIDAKRQSITEFNYEDCLPISKEQMSNVLSELHRSHLLNLRLIPGARQALQATYKYFRVIIATERPIRAKEDTNKWLQKKHIPNKGVFFVEAKIELLNQGPNWFIEDRWENAMEIANNDVGVILLDRPWNHKGNHKLIVRAHGWSEIVDILGVRLS